MSSGSGVITASNDITFATGGARTLSVAVQTTSNTAVNALNVQSDTGNGSGAGGALTVRAGTTVATCSV